MCTLIFALGSNYKRLFACYCDTTRLIKQQEEMLSRKMLAGDTPLRMFLAYFANLCAATRFLVYCSIQIVSCNFEFEELRSLFCCNITNDDRTAEMTSLMRKKMEETGSAHVVMSGTQQS